MTRVGIIGFGFIGRALLAGISGEAGAAIGLSPAFVHTRSGAPGGVAPELVCADLERAAEFRPDLIVEVAHPSVTLRHGTAFLAHADYMPLSLTALAEPGMLDALTAATMGKRHLLSKRVYRSDTGFGIVSLERAARVGEGAAFSRLTERTSP